MKAIDDSSWWRFPGGYVWLPLGAVPSKIPSVESGERLLSTGVPLGTFQLEEYRPPENLFLEFASTPDDPEGIKLFADRYGLLGLDEKGGAAIVGLSSAPDQGLEKIHHQANPLGAGELLSEWRRHISDFRAAVSLWSAITTAESGDETVLHGHVRWPSKDVVYFDSHPHLPMPPAARLLGLNGGSSSGHKPSRAVPEASRRTLEIIASRNQNSEWLDIFRPGDCMMPARYYLQRLVNEALKHRTSPKLLWNLRRKRPYSLALYFVPENLLGHMWLQFAQAVDGAREFRPCAVCKTWILIAPSNEGARSSRVTCSNACRMKRYEARMSEARKLFRNGMTVRQIAKRLEADVSRVKRWVAK